MGSENLECTRLSEVDLDQLCKEVDDLLNADKIEHSSVITNTVLNDSIHHLDLSSSDVSSIESVVDELDDSIESLNLDIAGKNKLIQEQETTINRLELLVEQLMIQVQRYKVKERKNNYEKSQAR